MVCVIAGEYRVVSGYFVGNPASASHSGWISGERDRE
jgi:hypothetical protein